MSCPNDTCLTAEVIPSLPFDQTYDTTGCADSPSTPDTPCGSGNSYNAKWLKWTCSPGVFQIDIEFNDFGSVGAFESCYHVFEGSCGALTPVDNFFGNCDYSYSLDAYPVTPGIDYFFLITSTVPGGIPTIQFRVTEHEGPQGAFCVTVACNAITAVECNGVEDPIITISGVGFALDASVVLKDADDNVITPTTVTNVSASEITLEGPFTPPIVPGDSYCVEVEDIADPFCTVFACGQLPPPPPPPGPAGTLILDTVAKRWMLDSSDKTDILTRLEEPGAGVYSQIVGGLDGNLYQFELSALRDADTDLPWDLWTPWFDGHLPRTQKQFGDIGVGLDPANSVSGILAQPVAEDGTLGPASVTLGQAQNGRDAYVIDLQSGGGVLARNLGVRFSGAIEAGDTARPRLFWWEPAFIAKAPSIARRATDWENLGYVGAKFVQGVIVRANTFGVDKSVTVQSDGGVIQETLTLNHNGEVQKAYPLSSAGWDPFVTELIRLEGADANQWLLLDYRFVWEPAPELATQWETQFGADWPGYGSLRDIVFAYEATAPLTFSLTYDDVAQNYTIPGNGGTYTRYYLVLQPGKGKAVRFKWITDEPARLYKRDIVVRAQGWGMPGGYQSLQPFGGPSRLDGAQI